MSRTHLLGAASAVVLACASAHAFAASTVTGGGSTLAQIDYNAEFGTFNAAATKKQAVFGTYYGSGSGAGQAGLLTDDLSCDINKVSGANGGACDGGSAQGAPGNTVDYGASDATLSSTQISGWSSFALGQAAAGNLIQIPSMGVGISIPVVSPAYTTNNGAGTSAEFSDNDLCGIFSGKITDWSQITDGTTHTSGPLTVVVRSDGSGTSFLLTNHLSKVCNSGNSNITFSAVTTFATLFPGSTLPSNFVAEKGSGAVASTLVGYEGTSTQAVGYLSPDYTSVDPKSGNPTNLVVAQILNGKTAYLPTTTNITLALAHPASGQTLNPPTTAAAAANPANWVPLIQTVSQGYPIVGYTTFDFAQCYADKTVAATIVAFVKDHYTKPAYIADQNNNGFVTVSKSGAAKFLQAVEQDLIGNKSGFNTNIENASACAGLAGR